LISILIWFKRLLIFSSSAPAGASRSMLARFSRISGDQSGDLAPIVPGLSRSESGATNFCTLNARACAKASCFPTQPAGAGDDYEPGLVLANEDFVMRVTPHRKASACLR
jgi:hypothetical protein